jgi:hypothetical protein
MVKSVLIAFLDTGVDDFRECVNLATDEGRHQGYDCQNDDDLWHESERHLLHLCQRLQKRDRDTDNHRGADGWTRCDDDRPNRGAYEIEGVCFVHVQLIVTPLPN